MGNTPGRAHPTAVETFGQKQALIDEDTLIDRSEKGRINVVTPTRGRDPPCPHLDSAPNSTVGIIYVGGSSIRSNELIYAG